MRFYAAWICRFVSVDPLFEKYSEISPFVYCANNPLKYVDPTGMWIEILHGGENYKYENGQLYQYQKEGENIGQWTVFTVETDRFLEGIQDALNKINRSVTGSELIDFFANDDNSAYIEATFDYVKGNSIDISGVVNIIYLKDNLTGSEIPTEAGIQISPFWLDVAHELAHRQDLILDNKTAISEWLRHPDTGEIIPKTEQYATKVENQIRADFGMSLRTHYVRQGEGVWENSRVLDSNRKNGLFGVNYFTGELYIPRLKTPAMSTPSLLNLKR